MVATCGVFSLNKNKQLNLHLRHILIIKIVMNRITTTLLAVAVCGFSAFSQNNGAITPDVLGKLKKRCRALLRQTKHSPML